MVPEKEFGAKPGARTRWTLPSITILVQVAQPEICKRIRKKYPLGQRSISLVLVGSVNIDTFLYWIKTGVGSFVS